MKHADYVKRRDEIYGDIHLEGDSSTRALPSDYPSMMRAEIRLKQAIDNLVLDVIGTRGHLNDCPANEFGGQLRWCECGLVQEKAQRQIVRGE